MKFHYEFDIKKLASPILHHHKLMLVGSCFTENMGDKLRKMKFSVLENPAGILFNPISVSTTITHCIENRMINESALFQYNEAWHSWDHHSRFSNFHLQDCLNGINQSTSEAHDYLKEADFLILTLGSAWVYELTDQAPGNKAGSVAANNHKAPSNWFSKQLLTVEQTLVSLDNLLHRLFRFNPKLTIIFTISPVRHLREGVIENNRSKAVLIQSVHHLVDKFNRLYYFPAYELVIDDLRDYRFYAEDLVHPNYHATQYVWEKLVTACMNEQTQSILKEIADINLAFQHKPFNSQSQQHQQFLNNYWSKTNSLLERHPYLDLQRELDYFALATRQ